MATDTIDYGAILAQRSEAQRARGIDVRSQLQHFALINYAVPRARLEKHIPADRFEIPEFEIGGAKRALLSVVPFYDLDFHFVNVMPMLRFSFGQTNHRVYVIDRATGEHCVWFFGTTLGSHIVSLPRVLWKIPWHYARYDIDCRFDTNRRRYSSYRMSIESDWCGGTIEIEDTGEAITLVDGFGSMDEVRLVLTHPLKGYFYRLDGALGSYSVWHQQIPLTIGAAKNISLSLYDRLGILTADEMQNPHSIFICPQTEFLVQLPPHRVR